eukprot:1241522-Amphidinium_carterae.1
MDSRGLVCKIGSTTDLSCGIRTCLKYEVCMLQRYATVFDKLPTHSPDELLTMQEVPQTPPRQLQRTESDKGTCKRERYVVTNAANQRI